MTVALQLFAVLLCISGEAFFSGMETGIISIRRLRLRHRLQKNDAAAQLLGYFRENPDRLLGTTLVGTNLCVVVASVLWANMSARLWGVAGQASATVFLTIVLLVCGEFIPKAWFRARPYVRSARFVRLLRWAWIVFRPFGTAMTWLAGIILPGNGSSSQHDLCVLADRGEFKLLATEGEQNGILTMEEREMIHRTIELTDRPVKDIMTPVDNVVAASSASTLQDFLSLARDMNFSRFPLRDPHTGQFTGIVAVLDVLAFGNTDERSIEKATASPVFLPAATPSDEIVPTLRLAHQTMGLVTDDGGLVIGLVTTDDVLKQIVLGA